MTISYPNMILYTHEVKCMGKAAGGIIQNSMADVEVRAATSSSGAVADRNSNSASAYKCYRRGSSLVRQSIKRRPEG